MSTITSLTAGKGREKKVNVFLDGSFTCSLMAEVALREGLRVGQELSPRQLAELTGLDRLQRGYNAAIRFLSYRPRSEAEVRQRLQKHGFEADCTDKVLARLKEQGLVDDSAFARFWAENRATFRPRSQRLTMLELRRKGLTESAIGPAVSACDDNDSAYRAALSQTRRWSRYDYAGFRRRLWEYLRRRGFDYEVIKQTVDRIWRESGSSS